MTTNQPTVTDCDHRLVHASTFAEGELVGRVALWSCDFCAVRFYPACPTCVDVGHRGVVHSDVLTAREARPDPSWQTDAEGYVTEPLVNEGAK